MLLLVDIGNTNITVGFYDGDFKNIWRLNTLSNGQNIDEYFYLLKDFIAQHSIKKPGSAIICSVVPEISCSLIEVFKKNFGFEPINVSHKLKTGLIFHIKQPDKLGADRIANAVAAHNLYKGHLIVIDFGTATTICMVSAKGEYKGGAIIPGLNISANVLAERTAKLPMVELRTPEKILGDDTESNILSGVILGHAGAVERIIKDIKRELSFDKEIDNKIPVNVIATGGFVNLITPHVKEINEINPLLTLEGLKIIHELNT